jgi:hypothetical protein
VGAQLRSVAHQSRVPHHGGTVQNKPKIQLKSKQSKRFD